VGNAIVKELLTDQMQFNNQMVKDTFHDRLDNRLSSQLFVLQSCVMDKVKQCFSELNPLLSINLNVVLENGRAEESIDKIEEEKDYACEEFCQNCGRIAESGEIPDDLMFKKKKGHCRGFEIWRNQCGPGTRIWDAVCQDTITMEQYNNRVYYVIHNDPSDVAAGLEKPSKCIIKTVGKIVKGMAKKHKEYVNGQNKRFQRKIDNGDIPMGKGLTKMPKRSWKPKGDVAWDFFSAGHSVRKVKFT
jgi:hypothetical protein